MTLSRRLAATLLVLHAVVVAVIVFEPTAELPSSSIDAIWRLLRDMGLPLWFPDRGLEFVLNVLMFVPLSFLGAVFKPRWGWARWAAAGFGLTLLIEVVQGVFLPQRSTEVVDLVANTLGALGGYWLVLLARRR